MIVSTLILRNWGPYRGEQRLDLGPTIYGVTASRESDAEASNYVGKTWLLSAIRFALFGWHPADREDGWITEGEREGSVFAAFDGGVWAAERSRRIGGSTKLELKRSGGRDSSWGRDAQQEIERRIGLGEQDFLAGCFFEQKQMSRFVAARPAVRFEDVSAWLRLQRLRNAVGRISDRASVLAQAETQVSAKESLLRSRLAELDRFVAEKPEGAAQAAVLSSAVALGAKEAELEKASCTVATAAETRRKAELLAEIAVLAGLEGVLDPVIAETVEEKRCRAEERTATWRDAAKDAVAKRVLAGGGFSGACPVNGGACPIASELNADRERNAALAREATERASAANVDRNAALTDLDEAERALEGARKRRERLAVLREQADRIGVPEGSWEPREGLPTEDDLARLKRELETLRRAAGDAEFAWRKAIEREEERTRLLAEIAKLENERKEIADNLETCREASSILGRNGAQRRIAEGALAEIEAGANALLSGAGIDLSVAMRWARPTDQLAPACDACGAPFPAGRRAKSCARCGAPRGPKLSEALDVELSARSGAAEDLAGIALSLAASAWLRQERDASWEVLCADEPFAACDARNRRALLGLIRAATGPRLGFRQAFVVAHSEGLTDGLPGRIRIVGGRDGARVSVG